jgi:hypothetical protein
MYRFYSIRLSSSEFDLHLTSYEKLKLRVGTAGGDGPRVVAAYDDHIVRYNELVAMSDLADHSTLYCCGRETANQCLSAMLIFHVYIVLRRLRYDKEV